MHCFESFVKGRWVGSSLGEVFANEFRTLSTDYCTRAVELGLVQVNGENANLDVVIKSGDYMKHFKHRHEPSVHFPIETKLTPLFCLSKSWIHFETDELLVVNKPSGIPVHPTGNFHYNTLTHILRHDYLGTTINEAKRKCVQLFPVHRLDRLTSGLVLLAKSADKACSLTAEFTATSSLESGTDRCVKKFYVARVRGAFPIEKTSFLHVKGLRSGLVKIEENRNGYWRVTAPIGLKSPREGHMRCVTDASDSKLCISLLRRRGEVVNGESIVDCLLITGRTHQIRVHLQHLGFPIANDPLYGRIVLKDSAIPLQVVKNTREVSSTEAFNYANEHMAKRCLRVCDICTATSLEALAIDEQDTVLWLHSYRFESSHWSFEVPLPLWASLSSPKNLFERGIS
ncbi:hypothetical protein PsorP6_003315 [Peronosclerospora sorghi]|uniref:Uncharacterized protein n=1 Tax=Peronosclerospora sorghi TaxID=230839 RepID=A0ACC0VM39_9STRA|nr:hypothetical protein PsorP6_003315 [Peronosclerospora sorghi]